MAQLAFVDTYRSTIEIFKFLKKAETYQKYKEINQKFEETDQQIEIFSFLKSGKKIKNLRKPTFKF